MTAAAWLLPGAVTGAAIGILLADPAQPVPPWLGSMLPAFSVAGAGCLLLGVSAGRIRGLRAGGLVLGAILLALSGGAWRAGAASLPSGPSSISAAVASLADREAQIAGTAVDDPRPKEDRQQVVLEDVRLGGRHVAGRLLAWLPRATSVSAGDRVTFSARLEQPQDFDGFGYHAYLARQGVGAVARAFEARILPGDGGLPRLIAGTRGTLLDGLNRVVPEPEAALGAGILLGVRTSIDPSVSDAFAVAGLTHVVAISGWNIAIVAALVARMVEGWRRRPGGRLAVPVLTMLAIGGYVVLVGASPSVVRAALMAGALLLGRQAGSRAHAASALMSAALAMALAAPSVLWDVGFQLSLLATAGLIAFGAGIESRISGFPGWLREPVALTMAAQLATLPIILLTFERLSLIAPLANVIVVPLVPLVMLASAVAAPVGALDAVVHVPLLSDAATWFAGGSAWLGLRAMIAAGSTAASVPLAALPISAPAWLPAVWYPALAVCWRVSTLRAERRRAQDSATSGAPITLIPETAPRSSPLAGLAAGARKALDWTIRPRRALFGMVTVLGLSTLTTLPDGKLHLDVLDVGQGDGILVIGPAGGTMLVDGGPDPDVVLRQLGDALPWWRRDIDTIILTHPHQDHVGGLLEVLRRFSVRTILDAGRTYQNPSYDRFLALARSEPGAEVRLARAGQHIAVDRDTTFEVWYPSEADAAIPLLEGDINNGSVVGLLRYGTFTALLTGDAKAAVEAVFAQRAQLRPIDVLKVGHHGSNFSSSPRFLAALRPVSGLISVGAGNPYGHPGRTALRNLEAAGIQVLRTDLDGTVAVETDGSTWALVARGRRGAFHVAGGSARRTGAGLAAMPGRATWPTAAGSIGGWRFPMQRRRGASWRRGGSRKASSSIRRASPGWQPRRPGWWRRRASRWTSGSSRSPPCCTTSTSP
jgi:competence protein ComEC